jgi:putative ABC transport system permease protein
MILSYLTLAIRQLRLYKTYSFINVVGLSTGLAACFVILVYVRYQTSFDKYNKNLGSIYLVTVQKESFGWTDPGTPMILGPTVRSEVPDVEGIARWTRRRSTLRYNDRVFEESACSFADPEIFKVLTLPLATGDLNATHKERDFLVISETLAMKYFGGRNPVGETITLKCMGGAYELKVTAVMKDIPKTSTFVADAIAPLYIARNYLAGIYGKSYGDPEVSWAVPGVTTYVTVPPSADIKEVEKKFVALSRHHVDPVLAESFHLFPLKDMYFHSSFMINNTFRQGDIVNVYIYSAAAFLLLFIACINYLMLSLGRASLRTREVGVRKVFGARNADLFRQTLVEAVVVTLLSLPIALVLVELFLQNLTGLLGTTISDTYFHSWEYLIAFVALTIVVGVVAGTYVSMYLSSFNPIDILKGKLTAGSRKVVLRRILMASQMILFLGLTLASLTIYKQLRFFQSKDMGFDKQEMAVFYPDNNEFGKTFEVFKNELQQNPEIVSVSGANWLPMTESRGVSQFPKKDHPDENITVEGISADRDYIETMGMRMASGVSLRNHVSGVPGGSCIINETAAKELGLREPVGELVGGSTVIGVVGDFNMHSLHEKISPLRITEGTKYLREVAVRIAPGNVPGTAKWIAEKGARFNNGKPLDFESFDERLGSLYTQEQKFATAFGYATGLAIFVACMGIFGMSLFVCQQKVKEIGIRKVLGATMEDVYYKLTREFVGLIFFSSLIAFPLAFFLVSKWLEQFVYRISISVWDFLIAAGIDIVIVLATVSFQAVRAALANPVASLRYE